MKKIIFLVFIVMGASIAMKPSRQEKLKELVACSDYGKVTTRKQMYNHKLRHDRGEDEIACEHCDQLYRRCRMRGHTAYMHSEQKFPCPTCNDLQTRPKWGKHVHTKNGQATWPEQEHDGNPRKKQRTVLEDNSSTVHVPKETSTQPFVALLNPLIEREPSLIPPKQVPKFIALLDRHDQYAKLQACNKQ